MSYVVYAEGKRGPGHYRAAIHMALGCVLLSGCGSGSDRFSSSSSFGSGYERRAAQSPAASSSKTAAYSPQTSPAAPAANYQPQPRSGFQLASANPDRTGGNLDVSRVDLPPLQPAAQAPQGTKTADGYGPYNQPPVADGIYTGPRVYTPYDPPRGDAPGPQGPAYGPGGDDRPLYDRGRDRDPPPPPPGFYRRSGEAPGYDPRGEGRVYEPNPEREYRDEPPYGRDRPAERRNYIPERGAYHRGPADGPGGNAEIERPFYSRGRDRGEGRVVIVTPDDTLYSLARRYGVTVDMIARANRLSSQYVRPGTEILIPRAGPAAYGQAQTGTPKTRVAACTGERCHMVKPGETLATIARAYGVTERRIAEANSLPDARSLKAGQTISIPVENQAPRQAIASATPQRQDEGRALQGGKAPNVSGLPADKSGRMGTLQDPQPLRPAPETKTAAAQAATEPACDATLANPLPRMGNTFRKPVEGKTIAQFGPQRDGTINEGVTISVPRGTPIKSAENGVVAYVGDELPGFGNLILIRHADEYVTAYAHADSILVKKCDVVKRGQPIATAGATGDANQPQLHFEIRKNSKPVDPAPLLGS
jgi:murein DD-endopeptidase MepM/ murein hydrolase activator NlpD